MKNRKIYLSDIKLLIQLYAAKPKEVCVFDPTGMLVDDIDDIPVSEHGDRILINLASKIDQFKGEELTSFDFVIDFGVSQIEGFENRKDLRFINQPSGQMRWLFMPSWMHLVLSFYNASGLRGKLIAAVISLGKILGLEKVVSHGAFTMFSKHPFKVENVIAKRSDHYVVFMGTPGEQRTVLFALENNNEITHFLKVPTNEASLRMINDEKQALRSVHSKNFSQVEIPEIIEVNESSIALISNLKSKASKRERSFSTMHMAAIDEFASTTMVYQRLFDSVYWDQIQNRLARLSLSDKEEVRTLTANITELKLSIQGETKVKNHLAHGDFTPWNIYVTEASLAVYDWEMCQFSGPALYDLFHFVYQKGILVDRSSANIIDAELQKLFKRADVSAFIDKHDIDTELQHKLYLLSVTTYFADVYARQELTLQNTWQLATWNEALGLHIPKVELEWENCRKDFMFDFNQALQSSLHSYLKFNHDSLEDLPLNSDLDIAVSPHAAKRLIAFCERHPLVRKTNVHGKSFMHVVEIYFKDGDFLSIDLINRFKRKGVSMFNVNELLNSSSRSENGIWRPKLMHDMEYTALFYSLNNAPIPMKYYDYFKGFDKAEIEETLRYFNQKYKLSLDRIEQLFIDNQSFKSNYLEVINARSIIAKFLDGYNYVLDTVKELISRHGYIITFSGVDGVGKSTIIKEVKYTLETRYRKQVVLMRHRPGILPILSAMKHGSKAKAEQVASITIPRQGQNGGKLSSALRFGYYYADYIIGQVYIYFRYIIRGKVVLYDRYYFDFINDSKRSNISVNRNLVKKLYAFIMKPRLNFFLYADPQTILARKQELSALDIVELSGNYKSLFSELESKSSRSKYTAIENIHLQNTLNKVFSEWMKVA